MKMKHGKRRRSGSGSPRRRSESPRRGGGSPRRGPGRPRNDQKALSVTPTQVC